MEEKEIIEKIKKALPEEFENNPHSQHIKLEIINGVIWSTGMYLFPQSVMNKMQLIVNQELGQKEYTAEFLIKKIVYARNEEEVKIYFQETSSKLYDKLHKIYETNE